MIDPASAVLWAVASPSPAAAGTLFVAGLLTSAGPCVAPRYVAVAALAHGARRPLPITLAFVGGLCAAFVGLGFGAGSLGQAWALSGALDATLGAGLVVAGIVSLIRAVPDRRPATCPTCHTTTRPRSLGAAFLLGAGSALVVSPCCTPVVATVIATAATAGRPITGALLLLAYAAGHALPLLAVGRMSGAVADRLRRFAASQAVAIVGATLTLALGAYYAVLA